MVDEVSLLEEELVQLLVKSSVVSPPGEATLVCTVWIRKTYNLDSFWA